MIDEISGLDKMTRNKILELAEVFEKSADKLNREADKQRRKSIDLIEYAKKKFTNK